MSAMDFLHQIRLGSYQLALPVPRILRLCNNLQNVGATTYIFGLQLSTFLFYNKHPIKKNYKEKISSGKHFHSVLCLSEAKGMDIIMRTKNKEIELNHTHFVAVRLTDIELNLLDQGTAYLSISRSEYIRKLLVEKQIHHQIARYFNTGGTRSLKEVLKMAGGQNGNRKTH